MTTILQVLNASQGHPAEAALRAINESVLPGMNRYQGEFAVEQLISDVGALADLWEQKSNRDESSFRFTFSNTPSADGLVTNKVYVSVSAIGSSDTSALNSVAPVITGLVPASSSGGAATLTRKTSDSSPTTPGGRSISLIYYAADDLIDRVSGGAKSAASLVADGEMDAHFGIRINKGSPNGVIESIELASPGDAVVWDTDSDTDNPVVGVAYSVTEPLFNQDDGSIYVPYKEGQIIHCFVPDFASTVPSLAARVKFKGDAEVEVTLEITAAS